VGRVKAPAAHAVVPAGAGAQPKARCQTEDCMPQRCPNPSRPRHRRPHHTQRQLSAPPFTKPGSPPGQLSARTGRQHGADAAPTKGVWGTVQEGRCSPGPASLADSILRSQVTSQQKKKNLIYNGVSTTGNTREPTDGGVH